MICGGRAYKGENLEVIVPFNVEDYENFTITFYTTGDYKITKTADEVEIVDGEVRYTFTKDELDVLPDGVLRYTIDYAVDNTDYVQSSNTMIVVKTPAGYSATSVNEMVDAAYESGYTAGYESGSTDCSGSSECNLEVFSAYQVSNRVSYSPSDGYDGFSSVLIDATGAYSNGHNDGRNYQKSLLTKITITRNGVYERSDGYSGVTVNVEPTTYFSGICTVGIDISLASILDYHQPSGTSDYAFVSIDGSLALDGPNTIVTAGSHRIDVAGGSGQFGKWIKPIMGTFANIEWSDVLFWID